MLKRWKRNPIDQKRCNELKVQTGLSPVCAAVLTARGCGEPSDVERLMHPELLLRDPMSIMDMDKAVGRVRNAIDKKERICIFGDYDADGVTSTAMLYLFLREEGADVRFILPHREEDGYGLSDESVQKMAGQGTDLVITVDNGIAAHREVKLGNSLGMDFVITDHHIPGQELPDAVAVVDPHRPDCGSGLTELSGAGVALCLVCGLQGGDWSRVLPRFSDLAALGTIADVMPLTGMNRAIVQSGLSKCKENPNPGLKALMEESGMKMETMTAGSVSFGLAPRINAAGRLESAMRSAQLLIGEDAAQNTELAQKLCLFNADRQQQEQKIVLEIDKMILKDKGILGNRVLVFSGENWSQGVIGIAASRVMEKYGRPTILFSRAGQEGRGSGRSREGFHLFEALQSCGSLLRRFGGHELAAGCTIDLDKIDLFRLAINEYALNEMGTLPVSVLSIDVELNAEELTARQIKELKLLEPYGVGNPQPLFLLKNVTIASLQELSGGKYTKLLLNQNGIQFSALDFSGSPDDVWYRTGDVADLVLTAEASLFRGKEQLSLFIRDIRPCWFEEDRYFSDLELYRALCAGENNALCSKDDCPERQDIAKVYTLIKSKGELSPNLDDLFFKTAKKGDRWLKTAVSLDALCETGLCRYLFHKEKSYVTIGNTEEKVDIFGSETLRKFIKIEE